MIDRGSKILVVERDGTRQRQRFHIVRVGAQRTLDEFFRLAAQAPALGHRQRVGIIGEQLRVIGINGQRLGIRRARRAVMVQSGV